MANRNWTLEFVASWPSLVATLPGPVFFLAGPKVMESMEAPWALPLYNAAVVVAMLMGLTGSFFLRRELVRPRSNKANNP